ncbi:MAG: 5'-methylthioadenosine/S-adenosylhomocysteine nucleosidase [Bdellovibrionales bacterium]|nr:5'-methylthioadenosine/S-adenosylhomocysteine nucleosidase [Bdellovibrionales bacterium]
MAFIALTPLRIEYDELALALRTSFSSEETQLGKLPATFFKELGLCLSIGGHGKTQFALQTQYAIDHFPQKISAVLCCGGAGSLSDATDVGDIIGATRTIEHDFKLRFIQKPSPEFPGASFLLDKLQSMSYAGFRIHLGAIASGDEDIISRERRDELAQSSGCIAVGWEGAGGARACAFNQIPFVELRGITDSATSSANTDFRKNIKVISHNLSVVLAQLVSTPSL